MAFAVANGVKLHTRSRQTLYYCTLLAFHLPFAFLCGTRRYLTRRRFEREQARSADN